jgi:CBS-domain-containing membrane protein
LQRFWRRLWPVDPNRSSHGEKWISAVGGFIGILAVLWISASVLDNQGAAMVVGSMGASAVLLFAVPHGTLSQPWAVVGGHLLSAFIGVSCAQLFADPLLAAAVAVGVSIGAMHYLHCIHPPGGATALVAVLGGDAVRELGYAFIFSPVLENVLVILTVAVLVNFPFRWRRYPAGFARAITEPAIAHEGEKALIAHSDLVYALSQLDSFIDVSEQDLIRIYTLAVHHTHNPVACHLHGEECDETHTDCLCRQLRGAEC